MGWIIVVVVIVAAAALLFAYLGPFERSASVSVPVVIDALRDVDETRMARATYFVVASDTPAPGWMLRLRGRAGVPVRVLGRVGVIHRPGRWGRTFRTPETIERIFAAVESDDDLSIETEDLWIPAEWIGDREPARGEVYRVALDAFQHAYRFRDGQATRESLLALPAGTARPSPEETDVFRAWCERVIERSKAAFPKNPRRELGYEAAT